MNLRKCDAHSIARAWPLVEADIERIQHGRAPTPPRISPRRLVNLSANAEVAKLEPGSATLIKADRYVGAVLNAREKNPSAEYRASPKGSLVIVERVR